MAQLTATGSFLSLECAPLPPGAMGLCLKVRLRRAVLVPARSSCYGQPTCRPASKWGSVNQKAVWAGNWGSISWPVTLWDGVPSLESS